MSEIFRILPFPQEGQEVRRDVSIGVNLRLDDREIACPIFEPCGSCEEFVTEVGKVREELDRMIQKARSIFGGAGGDETDSTDQMPPEKVWSILSSIEDEDQFVRRFNALEEEKRREVAEYVLTKCNIFSGKASAFSSRYSNETGLLE
jgi:hypothetical protein